jgi:hypothetical protein
MSNLLVARILSAMVSNSKQAPSTPTRRGLAAWSQEPLPTEGEDLVGKDLHISTPSGGRFYISRMTPPTPSEEGVVKKDRRCGKRTPQEEVQQRLDAYQRDIDNDKPIEFLPYTEEVLERLLTKSKKERIGKLAEAVKIGKMD